MRARNPNPPPAADASVWGRIMGRLCRDVGAMPRIALAIGCLLAAGCESALLNQKLDASNIFGPIGRKARAQVEMVRRDPSAPLEGSEEQAAAQKLFDAKEYKKAAAAFKAVAKKYKDKPIEEDAMFMEAESYFAMKHYPDAQDAYDDLFKKHPASRYVEKATERMFFIAQYWLNSPKPASQVELAAFKSENGGDRLNDLPDAQVPYVFPLTPNLFDRTRPLFDTQGNAMKALKSVWINDPSGPLADDALMLAATHHLRKGDFREADSYFGTIRETYADSQHAQAAYILGQHSSYQSYQGTKYDGKQLEEARKLTESTLRLYPDSPQRQKLEGDLKRMTLELARRDWERVQYHLKRREKDSAAVMAEYILRDFPDTPEAKQARDLLIELGPDYAQGLAPTPIHKPQATPVNPYDPVPDEAAQGAGQNSPEEPGRISVSDDDGARER